MFISRIFSWPSQKSTSRSGFVHSCIRTNLLLLIWLFKFFFEVNLVLFGDISFEEFLGKNILTPSFCILWVSTYFSNIFLIKCLLFTHSTHIFFRNLIFQYFWEYCQFSRVFSLYSKICHWHVCYRKQGRKETDT